MRKQVGCRLDQIGARREVELQHGPLGARDLRRPESEQRLAGIDQLRVEPQARPRGVVGRELTGRERDLVFFTGRPAKGDLSAAESGRSPHATTLPGAAGWAHRCRQ